MLSYVEQRSTDLLFYLMEGPLPRGSVQVMAETTLRLEGGSIRLGIIGSSHFLEIETSDGTTVTELLSCPRPSLEPLAGRARALEAAKAPLGFSRGRLSYRFSSHIESLDPERFRREAAALEEPAQRRLRYLFPGADGARGAVTCIEWEVQGHRAVVSTHHTFPGESRIVHTRSVIQLATAGA